ncbi:MAG TPA: DUF192 domain-containing protein [Candidatus Doudnabacteria bacterium]|nr:DUF192 domain-containing protein [Candidatus Doudnabacteria bacterium]
MKKIHIYILLFAPLFVFAGCNGPTFAEPQRPNVQSESIIATEYNTPITVANQNLFVEIVATDETRAQGLSGREPLTEKQGMLFDFTNTTIKRPSFWMKDMKFDIDIIWIADNKIIGITPNVPAPTPNETLPSYPPPSDITHVLEVIAGWSERNKVKVGDIVKL